MIPDRRMKKEVEKKKKKKENLKRALLKKLFLIKVLDTTHHNVYNKLLVQWISIPVNEKQAFILLVNMTFPDPYI